MIHSPFQWVCSLGLLASMPALGKVPLQKGAATEAERVELQEAARKWGEELERLRREGKLEEAIRAAEKVLAAEEKLHGELHDEPIASRGLIAGLYEELGRLDAAARTHEKVLELQTRRFGDSHWRVVDARLDRDRARKRAAFTPRQAADFAESRRLAEEAESKLDAGEYDLAVGRFEASLALTARLLGEKSVDAGWGLWQIGTVYLRLRDYRKAVEFFDRAEPIFAAAVGKDHPDYAQVLNTTAVACRYLGKYDQSERLFEGAIRIIARTRGERDEDYATFVSNAANLYSDLGKLDRALDYAARAVAVARAPEGADPRTLAIYLNNLGMVHRDRKEYDRADPCFAEALSINRKWCRPHDPDLAHAIHNLAANDFDRGEFARAEPGFRDALARISRHQEETAAIQSEAEQLQSAKRLKFYLDSMMVGTAKGDPAATYEALLRARGAVTLRRVLGRATGQMPPEAKKALADWRAASRQRSRLPAAADDAPDAEGARLDRRLEELEAALGRLSPLFGEVSRSRSVDLAQVQKSLPPRGALVDFVEYHQKVAAFVVTPATVTRVELGSAADLQAAIRNFRGRLKARPPAVMGPDEPAQIVRRLAWQPLAGPLKGVEHVLISPEGPICRLPFAALPAADGRRYLIEEVSISVVPIARFLPQLLGHQTQGSAVAFGLVGDVDFDAGEGPTPVSPLPSVPKWQPLPGTRSELDAILGVVRKSLPQATVRSFSGAGATKLAILDAAPKATHLHFATHGYFAGKEASISPAVESRRLGDVFRDPMTAPGPDPATLSGLVLSGANRPGGDTRGCVTAAEIGSLDLSRAELVTLSACETGLGETADGEGVLGLQRAFLIAGARTTLTTLWTIPDEATQKLMARFYSNLLEKKLGKLEALREAQLWMLREGSGDASVARGVQRAMAREEVDEKFDGGRLPPFYWAAFSLSGDWR